MTKPFILEIEWKSGHVKRINYATAEDAKKAYHKILNRYSSNKFNIRRYTIYDKDNNVVDSGLNRDYFESCLNMYPRKIFYRCIFTDPLGRTHERMDVYVAVNEEDYEKAIKALSVPHVEIIKG